MTNTLTDFKKYLTDFLPKENTRNQYFSQVNKFLKENNDFNTFCNDDDLLLRKVIGFINKNPRIYHRTYGMKIFLEFLNKGSLNRRIPKPSLTPRKTLNKSIPFESIKMLAKNTDNPLRQRLIMMCQYDSTCRIGAVLKIERSNILKDETNQKTKIIIIEKRGDVKTIYLSTETVQLLEKYLQVTQFKDDNNLLFQSKKWKNVYLEVWDEQKIFLKKIGENDLISSHWFRHSRIIHLLEKGYSILEVQRLTGHKDLNSLKKYLEIAGIQSRELMEKENPKW